VGKSYPGGPPSFRRHRRRQISDGEFIVIVGPSGCGKSTSCAWSRGWRTITEGDIHIGGRVVNKLEPRERDIAMVFQNYALYPHMSGATTWPTA
jgi:ABC-type sugar transport system ATPase subunit